MHKSIFAVVAIAMVLVSMVGPGLAATNGDLELSVTQDDSTVSVTVTDNGTAASNATVNVTVLEALEAENETAEDTNETAEETSSDWPIEGSYDADANGTVTLDAPEATVRIEFNLE